MVVKFQIYLSDKDGIVLAGDATLRDLSAILDQNMRRDNPEEIEERAKRERSELELNISTMRRDDARREESEEQPSIWLKKHRERRDLSEFHPAGELMLLAAGHSKEGEFILRKNVSDEPFNLEQSLLGACYIGSSNYLWQTVLRVAEKEGKRKKERITLPKLLMYVDGAYYQAEYDVKAGQFVPAETIRYEPSNLTLLDRPCIQTSYYKLGQEREGVRAHSDVVKYAKGELKEEREETHGRSLFARISEDSQPTRSEVEATIPALLYVTAEQVREVGRALSNERSIDFTTGFNRFLLYSAFMQTHAKGSFIVGQITGDSYVMHLPYVQVV